MLSAEQLILYRTEPWKTASALNVTIAGGLPRALVVILTASSRLIRPSVCNLLESLPPPITERGQRTKGTVFRLYGCRHCGERLIASPASELLPERKSRTPTFASQTRSATSLPSGCGAPGRAVRNVRVFRPVRYQSPLKRVEGALLRFGIESDG